mgnify:CR=1 FL=1
MNLKSYYMPKNKVGFIIATYEGGKIDWGYITSVAFWVHLVAIKGGKTMIPIIAKWLTLLCPMPLAIRGHKTLEKEKGQSS